MLQVNPTIAAIGIVGQEVVFTARAALLSYKWSVADTSKGRVEVVG